MKYQELVSVFEALGATTKRLEKTDILAEFFEKVDDDTLPQVVLMSLGLVFPSWSEEEQGIGEKLVIKAVATAIGVSNSTVEDQIREQGDIGAAAEKLYLKKSQTTFFSQPLTIDFVFNNLRKIAKISGNRSTSRKIAILLELLSSATGTEAKYICRTMIEELRIGVGEGIIRDAISKAYGIEKSVTERAHMLTNDLGLVAKVAKEEGESGLKKLNLTPGKPVKPMLAQLADGIKNSICEMGSAICEVKYDGIRVQIHKKDDEFNIFTRRLENITKAIPEMVNYIKEAFPNEDFIAEGEMIATKDGKPISFQNILQRVRRKYNIEQAAKNTPLNLYLFDILYFKHPTLDKPLSERRKILESIVNTSEKIHLSEMVKVNKENLDDAQKLFNRTIAEGNEGIMIKNPVEPYIPGIRGKKMLKFKAEPETLDVVVIGGTYGVGKRAHFIGSYLVALQDEEENELKAVAHVATGLDDETLATLTDFMNKYKIVEKGTKIEVEPRIILEIAYSEIVKSPEYPAGYSLRFPVVKRIRNDKGIHDIDTVQRLKSMFKG